MVCFLQVLPYKGKREKKKLIFFHRPFRCCRPYAIERLGMWVKFGEVIAHRILMEKPLRKHPFGRLKMLRG